VGRRRDEDEEAVEVELRGMRRKVAAEVDAVADALVVLSDKKCKKLPIGDRTRRALEDARRTSSIVAKKRHIKFLSGLLRENAAELKAVRLFLDGKPYRDVAIDDGQEALERLREELCDPDRYQEAFDRMCAELPHVDLMRVERLARQLHSGPDAKAYRALFKELRRAADELDDGEP
jgi:ribosomal 50S subunit-associated protein YjgA (DUF615 family)